MHYIVSQASYGILTGFYDDLKSLDPVRIRDKLLVPSKCAHFTCNESEDGTGTWELNLWECKSMDDSKKIADLVMPHVKLIKTCRLPDPDDGYLS